MKAALRCGQERRVEKMKKVEQRVTEALRCPFLLRAEEKQPTEVVDRRVRRPFHLRSGGEESAVTLQSNE